jgi:hypothetical protein
MPGRRCADPGCPKEHWSLAGRGSHVRVNATRGRPEDVRYPTEISRTTVPIGSRSGTWVTYLGEGSGPQASASVGGSAE